YRVTALCRAEPFNAQFGFAVRYLPRLPLRRAGWFHSVGLHPVTSMLSNTALRPVSVTWGLCDPADATKHAVNRASNVGLARMFGRGPAADGGRKFCAGVDAELVVHVAQVILDCLGAQEQTGGRLAGRRAIRE